MDWQKYLPAVVIGVVAIYLLSRMKGGGGTPIVSNALIPTGQPIQPRDRDAARTAAFSAVTSVAMGEQRLKSESQNIAANLELGRFRLQEQTAVLNAQGANQAASLASGLEALRARIAGDQSLADLQARERGFDRELQQRAIDQSFTLAQGGQISQGVGNFLGQLLSALGRGQQQVGRAGGGSMGGGGGAPSGATTPPFNPSGNRPVLRRNPNGGYGYDPNRSIIEAFLANSFSRNSNNPLEYGSFYYPDSGGTLTPPTLNDWGWGNDPFQGLDPWGTGGSYGDSSPLPESSYPTVGYPGSGFDDGGWLGGGGGFDYGGYDGYGGGGDFVEYGYDSVA